MVTVQGYSNTWKVLLDVIREQAPAEFPKVEKQVAENKNWTSKRSELNALYDIHHKYVNQSLLFLIEAFMYISYISLHVYIHFTKLDNYLHKILIHQ